MSDDPSRVHRLIGGACLIATPLLFAAAELSAPEVDGSSAGAQLDALRGHHGAVAFGAVATVSMTIVLLVGTFAVIGLVRRGRGFLTVHVAAASIVYGLVTAHATLVGANLVLAEAARPELDRSAMVAMVEVLFHDPLGVPLLLGHYVFTLGVLLLGVAVWRAHVAPRWVAACIVLFPVSDVLLSAVPVERLDDVVSNLFGLAGFIGLGLRMLRATVPVEAPTVTGPLVTAS